MRKTLPGRRYLPCLLLLWTMPLMAATFTGTVTNKTTGKPSPGDRVSLISIQAGMAETTSTTTDGSGRYSLEAPGMGPYLIRVTHQNAPYFIAAPQSGAGGDVTVYDAAAKLDGVGLDADMLLIEAGGGVLRVKERYMVRNTSLPPRVQFSDKTFEVVIPEDAELVSASATRPGGLGTTTTLTPLGQKGHYTFNIPIQPNKGEKETMLELEYHLTYDGSHTLTPKLMMHADHFVVYLAPGMKFSKSEGANFQATHQDPRVQTYVAMGIDPGQKISFTVSGEGQMAGGGEGQGMTPAGAAAGTMGTSGDSPAEAEGAFSRYKWWFASLIALALAGIGVYSVRGRRVAAEPAAPETATAAPTPRPEREAARAIPRPAVESRSASRSMMDTIKEELFSIESERLMGRMSEQEYIKVKEGLEALLKRTLGKGE